MPPLHSTAAHIALAEYFTMDSFVVAEAVQALGAEEFLAQNEWGLMAPYRELGKKGAAAQRWLAERDGFNADAQVAALEKAGVASVCLTQEAYPAPLLSLNDPPLVLFYRGRLPDPQQLHLAVIGSRQPDLYGRRLAEETGQALAQAGVGVISGGALGVDSLAHLGAAGAGGYTAAVLGQGLLKNLPHRQQELGEKIVVAGGAVISEYSPHTPPEAFRFPHRNRVISGLAHGVVVVQARSQSGTRITVRHALDQGKEVFAFPGNVYSELSQGCHELIRDGARLITTPHDVLVDLGVLGLDKAGDAPLPPPPPLSGHKRAVYGQLALEPRHIDALCLDTGLSAQLVGTALVMLEMDNLARQTSPGAYVRLAGALEAEPAP